MPPINEDSILRVVREKPCLDLRRLSREFGVVPHDEAFARGVRGLLRRGRIQRVNAAGRRAAFVATSFEH